MATLYADNSGAILGFALDLQDRQSFFPSIPGGTLTTLDFDEETPANASTLVDIQKNPTAYSLLTVAGLPVLAKNGATVTVAPAHAIHALEAAISTAFNHATIRQVIVDLWTGTASAAEQQKGLAFCLLKLRRAGLL